MTVKNIAPSTLRKKIKFVLSTVLKIRLPKHMHAAPNIVHTMKPKQPRIAIRSIVTIIRVLLITPVVPSIAKSTLATWQTAVNPIKNAT